MKETLALIVCIIVILMFIAYYIIWKIHKHHNDLIDNSDVRITRTILYGLFILVEVYFSMFIHNKSLRRIYHFVIMALTAQFLVLLLRSYNVMQLTSETNRILSITSTGTIGILILIDILSIFY
jgi:hypothetical protein